MLIGSTRKRDLWRCGQAVIRDLRADAVAQDKIYTANEMLLLAPLWGWGVGRALSSVFFHESQIGINCQSERWLCVVLLLWISIMNKNGYAPLADWSLFLFKSLKWVGGRLIYGVNVFFCHMASFFYLPVISLGNKESFWLWAHQDRKCNCWLCNSAIKHISGCNIVLALFVQCAKVHISQK